MELIGVGILVGILSGFFGIGGGTISVPLLLLLHYNIKTAIGISIIQMVFSSIFGSYINSKKGTLNIPLVLTIGIGGFFGAFFSGYLTSIFSEKVLEFIFLLFATFALFRIFFKPKNNNRDIANIKKPILFFIGAIIGAVSMTIGVGGSLILVPILVGFLNIKLKEATSAGLFFVIFSSISGLLSHTNLDYFSGFLVGISSLFGVYFGIYLKDIISQRYKKSF
jgi:uncharacterized membrane protein YfcA